MMNFNWYRPTQIFFGKSKIQELKNIITNYKSILLLYGKSSVFKNGVFDDMNNILKDTSVVVSHLANIDPNPRYSSVLQGVSICKENNVDLIIALGGGSVIDAAKAISLATNYDGDLWEAIKENKIKDITSAIDIAVVLTLAATGSEMNSNSVISNSVTKEKIGFSSSLIVPKYSVLDPAYTYTLPKHQIACGIVDSFSHCLEQLFSTYKYAMVSDSILTSIMWSLKSLSSYLMEPAINKEAYANLMWASTMALNGISGVGKSGDWSVHTIEHAVSAYYDITHAVGLAIIYPVWLEYILDESNYDRFFMLGSVFDINPSRDADKKQTCLDVIKSLKDFFASLNMPSKLRDVGVKEEDIPELVRLTLLNSESIGSIKKLEASDIEIILKSAF